MFKAFSGALSLLLAILVLRIAMPEVSELLNEIIVKTLTMVNSGLDIAAASTAR
jgi:hypothetical protein